MCVWCVVCQVELHQARRPSFLALQVSELEAAKEMPPPKPPSPVDAPTFAALCAAPPLQVSLCADGAMQHAALACECALAQSGRRLPQQLLPAALPLQANWCMAAVQPAACTRTPVQHEVCCAATVCWCRRAYAHPLRQHSISIHAQRCRLLCCVASMHCSVQHML